MRAYQIFQQISEAQSREIFHFLRTEEKEVYRSTVASLAGHRKLRPVFIQRKSPEQQYAWLHKTCQLMGSEEIDGHILQIWLLKAHQPMLVSFLDGLKIAHDGEGAAEDLPDTLNERKLKKTVNSLIDEYGGDTVAIYLRTFQLQKPGGWPEIASVLESDNRLFLGKEKEEEASESAGKEK
jgi:hypothetical protein